MTGKDPAALVKRSVTIAGHRTSVSLENIFWHALRAEADRRGKSLSALICEIDQTRTGNLSSALRVFAMGVGRLSRDGQDPS